jgi:CheY-like chemotaxis protein
MAMASIEKEFRMRVLIVDDQVSVSKGLQHACKKKGWAVELALSAEEALTFLKKPGDDFDGIVSDLRMPGLSGLELAKKVLATDTQNWEGKPFFILISAYLTLEDSLQALRLGVSDVFQKPFELEALLRRMEELRTLKKISKKKEKISIPTPALNRCIKGWDEYFLVEQKASTSCWNYFSMPKKWDATLRVAIGLDCTSELWARLEGALLFSLEVSLECFFDFLKTRGATDLLFDEKKHGLCVLDFEKNGCQGLFFGKLKSTGPRIPGIHAIDLSETLQLSPMTVAGESPLFFLSRKPPWPLIQKLDFENGKLMETLAYFGECLAEKQWALSAQVRTLSSLAEVLTHCQEVGIKSVLVSLTETHLRVEGLDISKRWQDAGMAMDGEDHLLQIPNSEDFVKHVTDGEILFEKNALSFSISSVP